MSEFEEWQEMVPAEKPEEKKNDNGSREGFSSFNRENNFSGQHSRFGQNGSERPRRPRFNTSERGYGNGREQGFRPEGFGRGNQSYGQRPQYNNQHGGFGNYSHQERGYQRQRPNYSQGFGSQGFDNEGGYQQRGFGNNGFNRGGYNQQRGGYGQRQQGYGQQRGGYGQRPNGYGQQRGFGQRPNGYGQQRGYNPNAKYSLKKRIEYQEYVDDPDAPIRLNKYLANAGVCSRREADQFIEAGVVKVNGNIVTELGTKVQRTDTVHFHDQLVSLEKKVYVLLNKPKDYVTTSDDPQQRKTVLELVKDACRERIYPVGRLDRNTTGVLLLTNDGDMASKLTHPKFLKKKVYHVFLDKNCTAADLRQIADGVTLEDGEVHADAISFASDTDKKQVGIEIHSGKNRIVRRIFESLGYRVLKLDRVMFCGLTKKGLKRGDWRFLTQQEVAMLHMGSFE